MLNFMFPFFIMTLTSITGYGQIKPGRYYSTLPDFGRHVLQINTDSSYWYIQGGCVYPKDTHKGTFSLATKGEIWFRHIGNNMILMRQKTSVSSAEIRINFNKYQIPQRLEVKIGNKSKRLSDIDEIHKSKWCNINTNDSVKLELRYIENGIKKCCSRSLQKGYKYNIIEKNRMELYKIAANLDTSFKSEFIDSIPFIFNWYIVSQTDTTISLSYNRNSKVWQKF